MSPTETEQIECPYPGDDYVTPASQTKQEAAAWMIEHAVDNHPGGLDPVVVAAVKEITSRFKQT